MKNIITAPVALILTLLPAHYSVAQQTAVGIASHRYERPGMGDRIFIGANYRRIWSMPVTLRVLHLGSEMGGLRVKELGGGMQTKSLHLEDTQGNKWVLRSVDKSVEKAMVAMGIKDRRIWRMSQKMISAGLPYGAVTIPPMAKALGIVSTEARVFFIPDDPALGSYRSLFANTVCILEKREPVLYSGDDVSGTEKMLKHLEQNKSFKIDEHMLLQARLLDMLVGDWDRHDVQWKWEYHYQDDGTTILYPIPRDHDQAYFNSTGLFINILRHFNVHMIVGFRKSMKLNPLNYKAWYFDKSLLKDLSENDWRGGVSLFQSRLSDDVLSAAVHQLPAEVYAACGDQLLAVLKYRRNKMPDAVMKYYHFLQHHPHKLSNEQKKEKEKMERAKKIKDLPKRSCASITQCITILGRNFVVLSRLWTQLLLKANLVAFQNMCLQPWNKDL